MESSKKISKKNQSNKKNPFAKKLEGLGFIDLVSLKDNEIEKLRKKMR